MALPNQDSFGLSPVEHADDAIVEYSPSSPFEGDGDDDDQTDGCPRTKVTTSGNPVAMAATMFEMILG